MENQAGSMNSALGCPGVGRMIEILLTMLLILIAWPIALGAMLAVRLTSPGSALYFQDRLGLRGRRIRICKIRTMRQDCERETGAVWSTPGDARVTRVGRFLRRCHIDELPQLIHILRGEMSLVGPRPERPEIVVQLEAALPHYRRRLEARPGLTGLAQVLQGPDSDLGSVGRKLELDLLYLERRCLSLDLKILLATLLHLVDVPSRKIARFLDVALDEAVAPAAASESTSDGVSIEATFAG